MHIIQGINSSGQISNVTLTNSYEDIKEYTEFKIEIMDNGDLYWNVKSKDGKMFHEFLITKENCEIWSIFDKLFNDIANCNIYVDDANTENEDDLLSLDSIVSCEELNNRLRTRSSYKEIFNDKKKEIKYTSDDYDDESEYVKIRKVGENYQILFFSAFTVKNVQIRIATSGSRYDDFYLPFLRCFEELKGIDYNYHQIHIEEILFKLKKRTVKDSLNILMIDDSTYKIGNVRSVLHKNDKLTCHNNFQDGMIDLIRNIDFYDYLILDMNFPITENGEIVKNMGLDFLRECKRKKINIPVVIYSSDLVNVDKYPCVIEYIHDDDCSIKRQIEEIRLSLKYK